MFIELPNGKTVTLSEEETQTYLSLPDSLVNDFLWDLVARGRGAKVNNPFALSYEENDDEDAGCDECLDEDELLRGREAFEEDYPESFDYEE